MPSNESMKAIEEKFKLAFRDLAIRYLNHVQWQNAEIFINLSIGNNGKINSSIKVSTTERF